MKTKTLLLSLILFMSFQLTQAIRINYEKPSIITTHYVDDGVLQIAADNTNQNVDYKNQGLYLHHFESSRYFASITTSRHSEIIDVDSEIIKYTNCNKIETSDHFIKQNRRFYTSDLRMRGVKTCCKTIQRNHNTANRNYYGNYRNHHDFTKADEFFTKDILLHRLIGGSYSDSLYSEGFYQTETSFLIFI